MINFLVVVHIVIVYMELESNLINWERHMVKTKNYYRAIMVKYCQNMDLVPGQISW